MLDLKGNTAVYMLYAHARIAGIIRKSNKDIKEVAQTAHISLDHASEVRAYAASQNSAKSQSAATRFRAVYNC